METGAPNGHKVLGDGTHLVCDASRHQDPSKIFIYCHDWYPLKGFEKQIVAPVAFVPMTGQAEK